MLTDRPGDVNYAERKCHLQHTDNIVETGSAPTIQVIAKGDEGEEDLEANEAELCRCHCELVGRRRKRRRRIQVMVERVSGVKTSR